MVHDSWEGYVGRNDKAKDPVNTVPQSLTRELSHDELKAFLAINFPGLELHLLPSAFASLLFAQYEMDEPINELFPSVTIDLRAQLVSLEQTLKKFPAAQAAASAAEILIDGLSGCG